jgi:hypothetical protein
MADEKEKKEYQSPTVVGDSGNSDEGLVFVLVAVAVVVAGNAVGAVNVAAAWNGGLWQNVTYTENWTSGPNPDPCSK